MSIHIPSRSLGNISKPSNAVLKCAKLRTVRIRSKKEGTRDKYITRRCRTCWQCVTSQQNDIVGKMLAESAVSQRIELWTLTYDGKSTESRIGAKQRCPEHVQKFQKAMRQRETRALTKYNREERKAAREEGRDPQTIDNSRSYIKFFPVFEFGSKNGRGHFHVMVFFESHTLVPLNALSTMEPIVCPEYASRVWDLPSVRGPATKTLPPDANNPDLIDYRVQKDGSQRHALWPHGFVNIECVSHDMRATDFGGRPVIQRERSESIVASMFYLLKYLGKPDTKFKGHDLVEDELREQEENLQKARGGKSMYRTGSQGIGSAFARAFGEKHAMTGTPLNHIHYRVTGANVPRSHESLTKWRAKLTAKMGPMNAETYLIEAQKMVFQMQGGMAAIAADTYIAIARAKGKTDPAMGDVALMRIRQLEAKKANNWLRSAEGRFRRKTARQPTLVDVLNVENTLAKANPIVGKMLSDGLIDRGLPQCILPPEPYLGYTLSHEEVPDFATLKLQGCTANTELEKLEATVEAIQIVRDLYRKHGVDPERYQREKRSASYVPDLSTPYVREGLRQNRDEVTQALYEQTVTEEWEKHFEGCGHASDLIYALELARGHVYRSPLKPWACVEYDVPQRLSLLWLNFSDQYGFTEQRERHIQRFCAVREVSDTLRLLITPDGRILMGRKGITDKYRDTVSGGGKVFRQKVALTKWGYREIEPDQVEDAIAGKVPLRSLNDGDPLFADIDQPFRNTWAMRVNSAQARVLRLPAPHRNTPKYRRSPSISGVLGSVASGVGPPL